MEHIPGHRNIKVKKLPIIIIISGKSGLGKSTLSYFLNKSDIVKYFSLDSFTVDNNMPIDSLREEVKILGKNAILNIHKLEKYVIDNMQTFIKYCYDSTIIHDFDIFIFDGVYFNNLLFLETFIDKFKKDYKIWITLPKN